MEAGRGNKLLRRREGKAGVAREALLVALPLTAGAWMRLWMLKAFPQISGDTLIYGGLAKNLLQHGRFALTDGSGTLHETLIRLPGYPLFLAGCFRLFGVDNYDAVAYVQIGLELLGCLLLAGFVRRIATDEAAMATLWLAALCPFTASYASAPLTETATLFAIALALWAMGRFDARPGWGSALAFTFAVTFAALLRPDGALVGVVFAPGMVVGIWGKASERLSSGAKAPTNLLALSARLKSRPDTKPHWSSFSAARKSQAFFAAFTARLKSCPDTKRPRLTTEMNFSAAPKTPTDQPVPFAQHASVALVRMGVVCVLLALAPFAVWTARNWRVFHVIEPLAPRYATDPGEAENPGWQRWVKSWCLDFVSTYDIYWNVPGGPFDVSKLPQRAFDTPAQYAETAALAAEYNDNGQDFTPGMDAQFGQLAEERARAHPLRFYLWLPLGRVADMWLRPRVENLPIDLDWWVYAHHNDETRFSWEWAGLNAVYVLLGLAGLCFRPRFWRMMAVYMVLRSALLWTIEAPEARYTLECFPMLFALGGVAVWGGWRKLSGFWRRGQDR